MCGGCGRRTMGKWSTYNRKGRSTAKTGTSSTVVKAAKKTSVKNLDVVKQAKFKVAADPQSARSKKMKQILSLLKA